MSLVVYSPYSGAAVKIRNEDIGRSVKDPDGRIFYVVAKEEGQGCFAAKTRKGTPEDLALALSYEENAVINPETVHSKGIYDATGSKRKLNSGKLFVIVLLLICSTLMILGLIYGKGMWQKFDGKKTTPIQNQQKLKDNYDAENAIMPSLELPSSKVIPADESLE